MDKKELWLKIRAYHFDDVVPPHLWHHITQVFGNSNASTKAFAGKIARKSGWTNEFALKAIAEYKKFVYLGMVSKFNVTPSKIIDQVWHEHVLFTKAYRKFCTNVIGYPFDHNPELISITDQTGAFNAQYLETIAFYKTEFGIDPPVDIWGVTKFDQATVGTDGYELNKKTRKNDFSGDTFSDAALVSYFSVSEGGGSSQSFTEFGGFGGGSSGGGGAEGGWGGQHSSSDSSFTSDGTSSGGDSGGDGGSSGCSSGCGGD